MRSLRRKIITLLCIFILLFVASYITGCDKKKTTTVRVNEVTHSIFYAPFYVAINEGYFEAEGITIELTNGGGSDKSMTALLSGQADIGLMGPETAVYVVNEGKQDAAVIFGQLTKRDGSFLLGKTPDPDFKWEKLKNKSIIGGRKGGMPQMTLEYVMKKHGVVPGVDATVRTDVQFNLMGGAFIAGDDDYVALFEPVASTMELAGEGYILASIGAETEECPYTCFMVMRNYMNKNKKTVEGFLRAVYKAQQWVKTATVEQITNAIAPSFPDSDKKLISTVVERFKEIDAWNDTPIMTQEGYNTLIAVIKEAGIITTAPDFAKVVDNSIGEAIIKEK